MDAAERDRIIEKAVRAIGERRGHPTPWQQDIDDAESVLTAIGYFEMREALEKAAKALHPIAASVYNDNGDMTVSPPALTYDECVAHYFAAKAVRAALRKE